MGRNKKSFLWGRGGPNTRHMPRRSKPPDVQIGGGVSTRDVRVDVEPSPYASRVTDVGADITPLLPRPGPRESM